MQQIFFRYNDVMQSILENAIACCMDFILQSQPVKELLLSYRLLFLCDHSTTTNWMQSLTFLNNYDNDNDCIVNVMVFSSLK